MAGVPNAAQVEALLGVCVSAVNTGRQEAEHALVQLMKRKESVPLFLAQISQSQNPGVRQLAAVLLRKKIVGHWKKYTPTDKVPLKAQLLDQLMKEPVRGVRLAVGHCIAMLARAEVGSGTWPELWTFLAGCSSSAEPGHREIGVMLLHAASHTIAPQLQKHSGPLGEILLRGLKDPEPRVRIETLRAVGSFLNEVEGLEEMFLLSGLLNPMMEVLQESFAAGSDEVLLGVFEVLQDVMEMPAQGKGDQFMSIVTSMLQIAGAQDCPMKYRQQACQILCECCSHKPKFVRKRGLTDPILEVSMRLLCDPRCTDTSMEADEDGVMGAVAVGSQVLDCAACGLPSEIVFPPIMQWINKEVVETPQCDPFKRRAAVMALGCLSMGCRDLLREHIEFVISVTRTCIADSSHPCVREAACFAASHFADYLQPEILDHHALLLPLGMELLGDQNANVRERAAYMVDNFAENLEQDLLPYAPALLSKLSVVISTPGGPETMSSREMAVSAISSIAKGLGESFRPFAAETIALVKPLLVLTDDSMLILRARATEAVGVVASACGREVFDAHFSEVCAVVRQGLTLEYSEVSEHVYGFWANMAEMYGPDWLQFIPELMPILLQAFDVKDNEVQSGNPFAAADMRVPDAESDSGSDSDDDEQTYKGSTEMDVKLADARCSALHCMGIFAKLAGRAFAPWVDDVAKRALKNAGHINPNMRKNIYQVLVYLVLVRHACNGAALPRVVGHPTADTLDDPTREALTWTLFTFIDAMRRDESKEVVAVACDCVGEICQQLGAVAIHNHVDAILTETVKMMRSQAVCQLVDDDGDEDDDALPVDHEQLLVDGVFDMVDKIAAAYGEGFRLMFDALLPSIKLYLQPKRPTSDHYMAIATLGECCSALGNKIVGHVDDFVSICVGGIASPDSAVRSNSCFTVGIVCAGGGESAVPRFPEVLQALQSVLGRQGEREEAVDNAVSAVCRLIRTKKEACFLDQVLPVVLAHVPLKKDLSESRNVYDTLRWLIECGALDRAAALQCMAGLLRGLGDERTDAPIRLELSGFVAQVFGGPDQAAWREGAAHYPPELQALIRSNVIGF